MSVRVDQSARVLLAGAPVRRSVCSWEKGKRLAEEAASAARCYGPQGQCRDRGDGKLPGAVLHADPRRSTVQEGAGEAVRGRQKRPQKTAQEIQRG